MSISSLHLATLDYYNIVMIILHDIMNYCVSTLLSTLLHLLNSNHHYGIASHDCTVQKHGGSNLGKGTKLECIILDVVD